MHRAALQFGIYDERRYGAPAHGKLCFTVQPAVAQRVLANTSTDSLLRLVMAILV